MLDGCTLAVQWLERAAPPGMPNQGNTCYMNAILQVRAVPPTHSDTPLHCQGPQALLAFTFTAASRCNGIDRTFDLCGVLERRLCSVYPGFQSMSGHWTPAGSGAPRPLPPAPQTSPSSQLHRQPQPQPQPPPTTSVAVAVLWTPGLWGRLCHQRASAGR